MRKRIEERIKEAVEKKTAEEIVAEMTKGLKKNKKGKVIGVNWIPLAMLQAAADVANTTDYGKINLNDVKIRIAVTDEVYTKMGFVLHYLEKKGAMISSISAAWKVKKPGTEMVDIYDVGSDDSQNLLSDGEYHSFTDRANAERFLRAYRAMYNLLGRGRKLEDIDIAIVKRKVTDRSKIHGALSL